MKFECLKKLDFWKGFGIGVLAFEVIQALLAMMILIIVYAFGGS